MISFARVEKNKQAIVDRGRIPLNCAFFSDGGLRSTITKKQMSFEFLAENNMVFLLNNIDNSPSHDNTIFTIASNNTDSRPIGNNHET